MKEGKDFGAKKYEYVIIIVGNHISHVLCFVLSAVYWTGYELLRARFADPGFMASFSSGVLSGAVSTFNCTTCLFTLHSLFSLKICGELHYFDRSHQFTTLQCFFYVNLSKLYPVRFDEWEDILQLKPGK